MDRNLQLNIYNDFFSTGFKLNQIDKISFFDELFLSFQIKIDKEKYPNSIYFFKDDTIYMELNVKSKERYLYCSYRYIWSIFEKEFLMEYNDIQSFIKERVELHFKTGPVTPSFTYQLEGVELHFKTGPVTPRHGCAARDGRWNSILKPGQ